MSLSHQVKKTFRHNVRNEAVFTVIISNAINLQTTVNEKNIYIVAISDLNLN